MTCNFRNAAGTDLDDIFYVINSNAGAIGFKCSNGQDLGNRYPAGSLGTNIGYKNNAGTDIGYLRTKIVTPTVSIAVSQINKWSDSDIQFGTSVDDDDYYLEYMKTVQRATITVLNGMPISGIDWYLEHSCDILGSGYWRVKANTSNMNILPSQYDFEEHNARHWGTYKRTGKMYSSSSINCDFAFYGYNKSTSNGWTRVNIKVVAYVYNQAGGTWVTSNEVQALTNV